MPTNIDRIVDGLVDVRDEMTAPDPFPLEILVTMVEALIAIAGSERVRSRPSTAVPPTERDLLDEIPF